MVHFFIQEAQLLPVLYHVLLSEGVLHCFPLHISQDIAHFTPIISLGSTDIPQCQHRRRLLHASVHTMARTWKFFISSLFHLTYALLTSQPWIITELFYSKTAADTGFL